MGAPDKIYIQEGAILRTEKTYDNDICYIRKDYLLEWAEKLYEMYMRITEQGGSDLDFGKMNAFSMMINKLNEV